MVENLVILKSINDSKESIAKLPRVSSKIYSMNYQVHKILEKSLIEHEIAEEILEENDINEIFDKVVSLYDWYNLIPNNEKLKFEGINVLGLMDTAEFHIFLIRKLYELSIIHKILKKEKPKKIITNSSFLSFIKSFPSFQDLKYDVILESETGNMVYSKIEIKFNIGKLPISFNISRKFYGKLKSLLEMLVCNFKNLWVDLELSKDTILLLEINPSEYSKLLRELSKKFKQIVLLNNRRSPVWNLASIRILNETKTKVLSLERILTNEEKKNLNQMSKNYIQILEKIWNTSDISDIFMIEGISFWNQIKDEIFETMKSRISWYLKLIYSTKKYLTKSRVQCVLLLNVVGETEKAILSQINKKIPSIMLEHGFANYIEETSRHDILSMYSLFPDKIAVWGPVQKEYLQKKHRISDDRIILSGSPRHDDFFDSVPSQSKTEKKTILLCPTPIAENTGHQSTRLHTKFEFFLKRIVEIIKSLDNIELIVKLHPGNDQHNQEIKRILHNIDSKLPIFHIKPIKEIMQRSDLVLSISPEGYDPSTIILESLILKKPIINVVLDGKFYDFSYEKQNAVMTISHNQDLKKIILKILNDHKYRDNLLLNGQNFLKTYLSNHGRASECLANNLIKLNS